MPIVTTNVIAIHQPNFFPWLGFFDKIVRSDLFVLLDHVQYPKTGGSWSNRVKLQVGDAAQWVTAPVARNYHGVRSIAEMHFQAGNPWREKIVRTLIASYGRAPFYRESMPWLEPLIRNPDDGLATYNASAITSIAARLGIPNARLCLSSELPVSGHATEMLVAITSAVGAHRYLCGGGASGYQDDALFVQAGVEVQYQNFQHPTYPQHGNAAFTAGLSIIDAIMHIGIDGVRELLDARAVTADVSR